MIDEWEDEMSENSESGGIPSMPQSGMIKNIGQNMARKARHSMSQQARKKALAGGKALAKAGGRLALAAGKCVVASLPYLVIPLGILLAFILLFAWIYQYDVEERPVYQNFQTETSDYDNYVTGDGVEQISMENLVESAFYMSYAEQSYFKSYNGFIERADATTGEGIARNTQIQDKYNRESTFYLSDTFLWALDKYLHGREYRYPEAFLRPLYMDTEDGNFKLKDLVDEDGNILVTSKAYDENGNRTDMDVTGVWDYGLAPVLNYKEFEEKARIVYNPRKKQVVVDTDGDGYADEVQWIDIKDDNDEVKMYEVDKVSGYPRKVYMIDKVATFLGVMENDIKQEWVTTGQVSDVTKKYKTDKIYEWETYYEETPVYINGSQKVILAGKVNGKYKQVETSKGCYRKVTDNKYELTCGKTDVENQVIEFLLPPTITNVTKTVEKQRLKEVSVSLHATYAGEQYEYIPMYVGEADFSDYGGDKYLRDYIRIYEAYIPENVKGDFDLSERVQANEEELIALVEQYKINFQSSKGSFSGFEASKVGEMSGTSLQNAYSPVYEPYFTKYAQMYGVDDRLLKAMSAQESSGNHDKYLSYERCSKAGCGLMQIEKPGKVIKTVTAYNFETQKEETVSVCYPGQPNQPVAGCLDVTNIDNNIKVGAMQFASRLKAWDYNVLMSLQSYNFGVGGMNTVLRIYAQQEGVSREVAISNHTNLGWMKYRANVHQNPSLLGSSYASWKSYGDDVYVENVLRYFPSGEQIVVKKPNGEIVQAVAELPGLTGADMSTVNGKSRGLISGALSVVTSVTNSVKTAVNTFGNFMKSNFNRVIESKDKWFSNGDESIDNEQAFNPPEKNATHFKQPLSDVEEDILIATIIAMEEGTTVSEVGVVDDSFWKAKAENFFMNPYDNQIGLNETEEKSSDPYFNGQAISPLKTGTTTVLTKYTYSNPEITLAAPIGTQVVNVYEGRVYDILNLGDKYGYTVIMEHTNGLLTYYSNLDKDTIKVFKNQMLKQGDVLGAIGETTETGTQAMYFRLKQGGTFVNAELILNPTTAGGATNLIPPVSSGTFVIPMPEGYVSCEWDCYVGHKGIDLGNNGNENTPIIASAAGVVVRSGWSSAGFGYNVIIKHNIDGKEYHTLYAHLRQQPMVNVGDQVQQGQQLGYMGNTGNSFGAHLHFQLHVGEYSTATRVNPRQYIEFPPERVRF